MTSQQPPIPAEQRSKIAPDLTGSERAAPEEAAFAAQRAERNSNEKGRQGNLAQNVQTVRAKVQDR